MNEELKLTIPPGLPGLEDIKSYTLRDVPGNAFFKLLQSAEDQEVAFLVLNPRHFFPHYQVKINSGTFNELEGNSLEDLEVYCIVTVAEKREDMTANLLAPLLVNREKGMARQVILEDTEYKTKHPVFSARQKEECG